MLLYNTNIVETEGPQHIQVEDGKIKVVTDDEKTLQNNPKELRIRFENAIAFPGLINSHDHLDFNLFPQIGNRIYNNYVEWGKDIHLQNKKLINAVLKIPQHLRTRWGLYKNLLNGITTVVNHGARLEIADPFISVIQDNHSLHSVQFEKYWRLKLNNIFVKKKPYVIHVGEGTDEMSHKEIDTLLKMNFFNKCLFAVHGVAMDEEQAKNFKALIWCPESNYFLLNATADIKRLKTKMRILFGTDSTLTADWNLWNHLRLARKTGLMSDKELYYSLTKNPAEAWKHFHIGSIAPNNNADIVIAKSTGSSDFENFYSLNPESIQLILHQGQIRLFDEEIKDQLKGQNYQVSSFSRFRINGETKYVYGNLKQLMSEISSYYPEASFPMNTDTE
ncbi:MAG TPA: amidohydrolase family protein [Chitinophagaceae bacterium]